MNSPTPAATIIHGGRIATLDRAQPFVSALAIARGRVLAIGDLDGLAAHRTGATVMIDLKGRTVVPGLNDSHMHIVREGLTYNMELRWDGVPSLADALRMLRRQAERTPAPQWVRVVGGWSEFQFAERRYPTLAEINAVAPDTPVLVLHLYTHAMMNKAALRALGYTRETPDPPGGVIERDDRGEPTGLLIATPSTTVLYGAIASAPALRRGTGRRRSAQVAVRYREDTPEQLARARAAVAAWRDQNPAGTGEELVTAIGHQFHRDYGVVLRALLFADDRHRARRITGIPAEKGRL